MVGRVRADTSAEYVGNQADQGDLLENGGLMARAEHAGARRSRQLIRQAFLEEIAEREFEDVSVTDVVRRAGVNRSTFYAHYSNISGLLADFESEIMQALSLVLADLRYPDMFENPERNLQRVADFLDEGADTYRRLLLVRGSELFIRELEDRFSTHLLTAPDVPRALRESPIYAIRTAYFTGGIINLYTKWLFGQVELELPEITAEVGHLIRIAHRETLATWGPEIGRPERQS